LEQILVSVIVIFIDFFNKTIDIFVICSMDQGRTRGGGIPKDDF
jgi:hypothetical protein